MRNGAGAMTGALTLSGDPTTSLHAATKQYVDAATAIGDFKDSVKCATTANITLSGEQTLDGILTSTSRVLVRAQTAPAENGIYVSSAGAWSRGTDMDAWTKVPGAFVAVEEGTLYADRVWLCSSNTGGTLGTTAITWAEVMPTATNIGGSVLGGAISGATEETEPDADADFLPFYDASAAALRKIKTRNLKPREVIIAAVGDDTAAITAGTAKLTFRMPFAMTLFAGAAGIRASLATAQTSGSLLTVDVNEAGATILSTKITIDNTEKTSVTAATAPALSDTALADDAEMTIDVDTVGDGTAKGLKVTLMGYRT
jgi:hypothetical protein